MTVARDYAEMLEALEDLLLRFKRLCPDEDGKIDPVDSKLIRNVEAVIRKARETAGLTP
jgi:hypothetical protein